MFSFLTILQFLAIINTMAGILILTDLGQLTGARDPIPLSDWRHKFLMAYSYFILIAYVLIMIMGGRKSIVIATLMPSILFASFLFPVLIAVLINIYFYRRRNATTMEIDPEARDCMIIFSYFSIITNILFVIGTVQYSEFASRFIVSLDKVSTGIFPTLHDTASKKKKMRTPTPGGLDSEKQNLLRDYWNPMGSGKKVKTT